MADLSTPSAADMATARQPTPTIASKDQPAPPSRPERPDEEQYKEELAKAEKELKSVEERMVCIPTSGQEGYAQTPAQYSRYHVRLCC